MVGVYSVHGCVKECLNERMNESTSTNEVILQTLRGTVCPVVGRTSACQPINR